MVPMVVWDGMVPMGVCVNIFPVVDVCVNIFPAVGVWVMVEETPRENDPVVFMP